jgi:hypothetical protein
MSHKITYNGIDANNIDWEIEFKVNKVGNSSILIPKGQTEVIKQALKFYISTSKEFIQNLDEEMQYTIFDMEQLCAMMDYPISITITDAEKEKFCGNHGIDFPIYK